MDQQEKIKQIKNKVVDIVKNLSKDELIVLNQVTQLKVNGMIKDWKEAFTTLQNARIIAEEIIKEMEDGR